MSFDFYLEDRPGHEVFSANITHNLGPMARAAGVYKCLWWPDGHGFTTAGQIIKPLAAGLVALHEKQEELKALNPANGSGDWEYLVRFVAEVAAACVMHPEASIRVWR